MEMSGRDPRELGQADCKCDNASVSVVTLVVVVVWVLLNVVHFSRCVTSFSDCQRVVLTRLPHRSASLLAVRVRRRSCRDCRHQSAQGSFDSELVLLGVDNIGCGARKCPLMQWRHFV